MAPAKTMGGSAGPRQREVSGVRVLVVDDSAVHRERAGAMFRRWGIAPAFAHDGLQAVHLVATRTCDWVLMDIVMPVMDGYTATTCIRRLERENPALRPLPVVAYSTSALPEDPQWLRALGFSESVRKPSTADRLQECLLRWCPDRFGRSVFTPCDPGRSGPRTVPQP